MTSLLLFDTPVQTRRRFVNNVADAVGRSNVRAFYTPSPTEGLTEFDPIVTSRVWTHSNTPTGRLQKLGSGYALSFNGTTDYISAPDAADLSFNGVTDAPVSVLTLFKGVATATLRTFLSKYNTANREYYFVLASDDKLYFQAVDESAGVAAFRASNAAPTTTSWTTLGCSYDGTGGATAANGMSQYQNGAALASTATNNAGYVAMENLAAVAEIGSQSAHTTGFLFNQLALQLLVAANLTAAQHAALNGLCRSYFGVPA